MVGDDILESWGKAEPCSGKAGSSGIKVALHIPLHRIQKKAVLPKKRPLTKAPSVLAVEQQLDPYITGRRIPVGGGCGEKKSLVEAMNLIVVMKISVST